MREEVLEFKSKRKRKEGNVKKRMKETERVDRRKGKRFELIRKVSTLQRVLPIDHFRCHLAKMKVNQNEREEVRTEEIGEKLKE